jgi:outer membrane protein OmpA-like peptidoglycan-associated protein
MSRLQVVLTGAGSLLLLIVACAAFSVPRIEAELGDQVNDARDKADYFWATVEAEGQHITLTGIAPDYVARQRLVEFARMTQGVTRVDNQILLVGESGTCQQEFDGFLATQQIEFATSSARIEPSSYSLLAMLAAIARNCEANIQVIGHTDGEGDRRKNIALSRERAASVKLYLVRSGVAKDRIEAIGYGESRPIADNNTAAGREQNRRIEFRVSGMKS